ncbi:nucleoside hydrolase [Paenibacillus sp.]|uniref:nucleoside hydrolase n=1 Tax=Paenibacillus sp. TaxID=58172 RepID=UPI002D2FDD1B|nr:nucleoside hydrolase [Paenibacillus sp.]HZG83991.1 nucleoside hydrolase [Paenibacillus sp.]
MTEQKLVYMNHDGGADDLVSLLAVLLMKDVELIGVGVIPGDCYLEPAVLASRKIIDVFGRASVEVSASDSRPKHPFPKEWRMHAYFVDALPMLNERDDILAPFTSEPAHRHLVRKLREADRKVTLLFTGPLTDLSRALAEAPDIEEKIESLVWMGGSFKGTGNIIEPEHDGSAEWNAFWDPDAVADVWRSGIDIVAYPLLATDQVPWTLERRNAWAKLRRHPALDFAVQCYAMCPPLVHIHANDTYFLWDLLTTSHLGNAGIAKFRQVACRVHTEGASQGRIEEDPSGRTISIAAEVDVDAFYNYITELFRSFER